MMITKENVKEILGTETIELKENLSVEQAICFYRYHKNQYSPDMQKRIQKEYQEYKKQENEQRESFEKRLKMLIRIRDEYVSNERKCTGISKALENSHYGMEEVKEKILNAIVYAEKTGRGCAVLLYGAPGVGKTSLIQQVAREMGQEYGYVTLNAADDVDIKGHDFTYKNSHEGRITEAFSNLTQTKAIIQLDEGDKCKEGAYHSLHDLLDNNQCGFYDRYLDAFYDVSRCVFIMTANDIQKIPSTILDRFHDKILVHGYSRKEKRSILKDYIVPKQLQRACLEGKIEIGDEAVDAVLKYCPEVGIRDIEQALQAILAYVLRKNDKGNNKIIITEKIVNRVLGDGNKTPFLDNHTDFSGTGQVRALAVAGEMGVSHYVQVTDNLRGEVNITGMEEGSCAESIQVALTVCRNCLKRDISNIHIHMTMACKKDGDSAGAAIAMAILSHMKQKAIEDSVCMTGALDVNGYIHPVGGLDYKLSCAERLGATLVFIPWDNYYEDKSITKYDLDIVPIKHIDEIAERLGILY